MLSARNLSVSQATLIGLIAPICWGMSVSLVRGIAEGFGLAQGQFLLYCVSTLCVLFTVGLPGFKKIDKRYLFFRNPDGEPELAFLLSGDLYLFGRCTDDGGGNGELSLAVAHHPLCRSSFQPHRYALVVVPGACGWPLPGSS